MKHSKTGRRSNVAASNSISPTSALTGNFADHMNNELQLGVACAQHLQESYCFFPEVPDPHRIATLRILVYFASAR